MNKETKEDLQRIWLHKFEEYDFHPEYFESGEWLDILDLVEQAYLQGAKDMREAVTVQTVPFLNYTDERAGWDFAQNEINRKAQQFIDSLKKGENNE